MAPPFAPPLNPILNPSYIGGQDGPAYAVGPQGCVGIQVSDITLSGAQLITLFTLAIPLLAAPGLAGFMLMPHRIIMRMIGGSAALVDGGGGAVSFSVGGLSCALAANTIFLVTVSPNRRTQVLDFFAAAVGVGVLGTAANPPTEDNAPLNLNKATANFTGGTAASMHFTTYYTVEPSL